MIRTLALLVLMTGCRCTPEPAEPASPDPAADLVTTSVTTVLMAESVAGCQECAMDLRVALRQVDGLEHFDVALKSGRVTVRHRYDVTPDQLVAAAAERGFAVVVLDE